MDMSDSSSSDRSDGDDWDDMAIVRAFEDALADKRADSKGARANGAKRGKEKRAPSTGTSWESAANGRAKPSYAPTSSPQQYDSAAYQAKGGYASAQTEDPYQQHYPSYQPQQQHQSHQNQSAPTTDAYQDAYAQAYAAIMAQMQAAAVSGGGQLPSFPPQAPIYNAPHPPSFPPQASAFGHGYGASIPTPPFSGAAGFTPAAQVHHGASSAADDGLANLLLAWYQSGYYTGRFQAMQEMRSRTHR